MVASGGRIDWHQVVTRARGAGAAGLCSAVLQRCAALVGTRDLGQEVYVALTKADTGRGIVAGLCVAFIAITS